jgi:FkbM family methyltransferase
MSSYINDVFTPFIQKDIRIIFELGSYTLSDAVHLYNYYKCPVYAFECDEGSLKLCKQTIQTMTNEQHNNIHLIESAVCINDGPVTFKSIDTTKYVNIQCSSMLQLDFSKRSKDDSDYGKSNVQKDITVPGIRLDTFMINKNIYNIDLLCMDLQGYELMALMSLNDKIKNVKYIITECQMKSTYINGTDWNILYNFLKDKGFDYVRSDKYLDDIPEDDGSAFNEFNALFKNRNM